jgi:hypothetical protein
MKVVKYFEDTINVLDKIPKVDHVVLDLKTLRNSLVGNWTPRFDYLKENTNFYFVQTLVLEQDPFSERKNFGEFWGKSFQWFTGLMKERYKDFNIYVWLTLKNFDMTSFEYVLNMFHGELSPVFVNQLDITLVNFEDKFEKIKGWTKETPIIKKMMSTTFNPRDNIVSRIIIFEKKKKIKIVFELPFVEGIKGRVSIEERLNNLKYLAIGKHKEVKSPYMEELVKFLQIYEKLRMGRNVLSLVESKFKGGESKEFVEMMRKLTKCLEDIQKEGKKVPFKIPQAEPTPTKIEKPKGGKDAPINVPEKLKKANFTEKELKEATAKVLKQMGMKNRFGIKNINVGYPYVITKKQSELLVFNISKNNFDYIKVIEHWEKNLLTFGVNRDTFEVFFSKITLELYIKNEENEREILIKEIKKKDFLLKKSLTKIGQQVGLSKDFEVANIIKKINETKITGVSQQLIEENKKLNLKIKKLNENIDIRIDKWSKMELELETEIKEWKDDLKNIAKNVGFDVDKESFTADTVIQRTNLLNTEITFNLLKLAYTMDVTLAKKNYTIDEVINLIKYQYEGLVSGFTQLEDTKFITKKQSLKAKLALIKHTSIRLQEDVAKKKFSIDTLKKKVGKLLIVVDKQKKKIEQNDKIIVELGKKIKVKIEKIEGIKSVRKQFDKQTLVLHKNVELYKLYLNNINKNFDVAYNKLAYTINYRITQLKIKYNVCNNDIKSINEKNKKQRLLLQSEIVKKNEIIVNYKNLTEKNKKEINKLNVNINMRIDNWSKKELKLETEIKEWKDDLKDIAKNVGIDVDKESFTANIVTQRTNLLNNEITFNLLKLAYTMDVTLEKKKYTIDEVINLIKYQYNGLVAGFLQLESTDFITKNQSLKNKLKLVRDNAIGLQKDVAKKKVNIDNLNIKVVKLKNLAEEQKNQIEIKDKNIKVLEKQVNKKIKRIEGFKLVKEQLEHQTSFKEELQKLADKQKKQIVEKDKRIKKKDEEINKKDIVVKKEKLTAGQFKKKFMNAQNKMELFKKEAVKYKNELKKKEHIITLTKKEEKKLKKVLKDIEKKMIKRETKRKVANYDKLIKFMQVSHTYINNFVIIDKLVITDIDSIMKYIKNSIELSFNMISRLKRERFFEEKKPKFLNVFDFIYKRTKLLNYIIEDIASSIGKKINTRDILQLKSFKIKILTTINTLKGDLEFYKKSESQKLINLRQKIRNLERCCTEDPYVFPLPLEPEKKKIKKDEKNSEQMNANQRFRDILYSFSKIEKGILKIKQNKKKQQLFILSLSKILEVDNDLSKIKLSIHKLKKNNNNND